MATVSTIDRSAGDASKTDDLPWLAHLFDAQTRHELAEEDREALGSISVILLAIVAGGLLLGATAVIIASWT